MLKNNLFSKLDPSVTIIAVIVGLERSSKVDLDSLEPH